MAGRSSPARSQHRFGSPVDVALQSYTSAMLTALLLTLPFVGAIGAVGVVTSLAQSMLGIQDQNISFGPKIAVAAACIVLGGPLALAMLERLFLSAIGSLPHIAS